jgi:hypothetical protein
MTYYEFIKDSLAPKRRELGLTGQRYQAGIGWFFTKAAMICGR